MTAAELIIKIQNDEDSEGDYTRFLGTDEYNNILKILESGRLELLTNSLKEDKEAIRLVNEAREADRKTLLRVALYLWLWNQEQKAKENKKRLFVVILRHKKERIRKEKEAEKEDPYKGTDDDFGGR